jgi:hypothetical protein
MRYAVLIGAIVLGAAIISARPASPPTELRERRVEVPIRVEVPVEVPKIVERVRVETRIVEKVVVQPGTVAGGVALAHEKMLFLFEREVNLRPEQRHSLEELLSLREKEIETYQSEIRASHILHMRTYERRIQEIQGAYYQKMGRALDEEQRDRFADLVLQGRLGDAIVFDAGSGSDMVVLED